MKLLLALLIAATVAAAIEPSLRPPLGFPEVPSPPDNPLTAAKVSLGARLFSDRLLSADRTVSCATCHRADYGFTVPERFGRGVGGVLTPRRPPTLLNRAYGDLHFWDGRAASLEELALLPIQHPGEMALSLGELERRLRANEAYAAEFRRVFGREANPPDVARALAAFLRTLLSEPVAYDRFVGGDARALSAAAQRGYELFRGKARCITCHWEPFFTDEEFHNTGVAARQPVFDRGRANGAFKTPTLHGVSGRPPYMHDGSFASLEEVVEFYSRGGQPNPGLDGAVRPLNLTEQEKADLLAFLKSL